MAVKHGRQRWRITQSGVAHKEVAGAAEQLHQFGVDEELLFAVRLSSSCEGGDAGTWLWGNSGRQAGDAEVMFSKSRNSDWLYVPVVPGDICQTNRRIKVQLRVRWSWGGDALIGRRSK